VPPTTHRDPDTTGWPWRWLAVAVAALTVAGCGAVTATTLIVPAGTPTTTTDPAAALIDKRVFVEGDSLTVGIAPYLPALLSAEGWDVTIDAEVGRLTATGLSLLAGRADEIGGTLVVALGTNDAPDPVAYAARIDEVMALAAGRRVIWVGVARSGYDALDEVLIAAQYRWSNLHVIDWRPIIAAHPDMRAADGIHLTDAGYQLRAEVIAQAIARGA
jgi:lysophospholipase L1-like esterase